ncbi:alpha-mannosidase [Paenarthrobacter sp. CM16]|uniref:glycosyl hydrolase n=1 Tax=Paenarthrobacter sp. CM16 TaxID=2738447 RepID=UPI0015544255|nr:glycosyl hydrolase [Paenarthrobacter sp. CM16]NQD88014.1 alpha-mannosidase [Paenarthrobacter sp. CM16]
MKSSSEFLRRLKTCGLTVLIAALASSTATSASAAPLPAPGSSGPPERVSIVDPEATPRTASLFAYLQSQQGKGILFGHQQDTEFGVTFPAESADGFQSDVKAATGEHPAVFGWDFGHDGYGSAPGSPTPEENFQHTVSLVKAADKIGGIQTFSAHMDNFATGGAFDDTDGGVVPRIMPGGDKNKAFTDYLDRVARIAKAAVDENGAPIPMVFRPFHENAGSWFWWGAAHASSSQYVELFRYTVEYLRDTKDVHNFLYSYSPGGGFSGTSEVFMRTYPGDDFVDVLGYDNYDSSGGSQQWLDGLVADLGMISRLAEERGKVAALTEVGVSGALKENGQNADTAWYSHVLAALKADPDARRMAWMLTWTNYGTGQFFVPYPATGELAEHEMLPDFRAFAADEFTVFSGGLSRSEVWQRKVKAADHAPALHVVSPVDGARITETRTTVRVRVSDAKVKEAWFTVGDDGTKQQLTYDAASGYFTGALTVPEADLVNTRTNLAVTAALTGKAQLTAQQQLVLGAKPAAAPGVVDDFETYADDSELRATYSAVGANSISLSSSPVGSGERALRFDYDFRLQNYTGITRRIEGDWSGFDALSLWLKADGSQQKLVLQLVCGGVAYEAYPSLSGTEGGNISIPFADFRPAPWDTANAERRITSEDLKDPSQFNIFINQVPDGQTTTGTIYLDELKAG